MSLNRWATYLVIIRGLKFEQVHLTCLRQKKKKKKCHLLPLWLGLKGSNKFAWENNNGAWCAYLALLWHILLIIMLSMLGNDFSRRHFEILFWFFPEKLDLTFHANCLLRRQFAWNIKSYFLGKIKEIWAIYHLLNLPHSTLSDSINPSKQKSSTWNMQPVSTQTSLFISALRFKSVLAANKKYGLWWFYVWSCDDPDQTAQVCKKICVFIGYLSHEVVFTWKGPHYKTVWIKVHH